MSDSRLKIAIVGLGKMGLLHASLLSTLPETQIVAVCDKSALMNMVFKKVFSKKDIKVLNNTDKLSGLDLDAVYVTTPISSHYPIIKELLTTQITRNIFVEKTLASNYDQSKELCELAKKNGSLTMVGYMKRYSAVFGKAKQLLREGKLGEPQSFKSYAFSSDFLGLTKESQTSAARGGAIKDIGCHIIDLTLWLLGDFKVTGILSCTKSGEAETSVSFNVLNPDGVPGQFDISQCVPNYRLPEFGCSIKGPKGAIDVNDDRVFLTLKDGTKQSWYRQNLDDSVQFALGETEYFRENQEYINALKMGRGAEPPFESASKVDYIIGEVKRELL
ncbi:MAG: Gfo/Idh/MocA family oxidoreductase [Candidatus Bathyarchaeota archaeon]|nr:Gfo/Idh/MocA family oxidoreductase [Candidatus Bathyarchaeota archaeon]